MLGRFSFLQIGFCKFRTTGVAGAEQVQYFILRYHLGLLPHATKRRAMRNLLNRHLHFGKFL
jgi:hypothetical protein